MEVSMNFGNYEEYKKKQESLAKLLEGSGKIVSALNMQQYAKNLESLGQKVHNENFKVQVVGAFKNGKSTFINSILGEEILPAYTIPTTAVINEIKWGPEKKAVLYFQHPLPEKLPDSIPEKALSHMNKYKDAEIPPMEIPYDEIEDYAVIPFGEDPKQSLLESPYAKIELFYPLPLLENGVEIIDSPGLNEHPTRTKVTMEYLSKADAIIFVLRADQACGMDEMEFIERNLKAQGFNDPFFVFNRIDTIPQNQRGMLERFAKQKLSGYSSNEIYYVSARNALDGKMEGDSAKYQGSGMKAFEERLSQFLTKEKGKAKLAQPARELKRIINEEVLFKTIPNQRNLLSTSLNEVKKRYEDAKPRLSILETKKQQIIDKLLLKLVLSGDSFKRAFVANSSAICGKVPEWVKEAQVSTKLGRLANKATIEAYANELNKIIDDKVEEQKRQWKTEEFMPLVKQTTTSIMESVEADIKDFFSGIDRIQDEINGGATGENDTPIWERIVSMSGELSLSDGKTINVDNVAMSTGKKVALAVAGGLALFTSVLFIPAVVALLMGGATEEKVKDKVSSEIVNKLTQNANAQAEEISKEIVTKLHELVDNVSVALEAEIEECHNQVKGIIAELEKGQQSVDEKTAEINKCEADIKDISKELDTFMFALVG